MSFQFDLLNVLPENDIHPQQDRHSNPIGLVHDFSVLENFLHPVEYIIVRKKLEVDNVW